MERGPRFRHLLENIEQNWIGVEGAIDEEIRNDFIPQIRGEPIGASIGIHLKISRLQITDTIQGNETMIRSLLKSIQISAHDLSMISIPLPESTMDRERRPVGMRQILAIEFTLTPLR
jgi:hypothetical protein